MPTLPELVPDLDALLAMPPENLGPNLIRAAEGMLQGGKFHPNNLLDPTLLYGRGIPTGRPVYPGGRERDIDRAVREGLQWLDHNGFTVAADANGWVMFTRKGHDLLHPPVQAPRPAGPEATPFDAFEVRQTRRLNDMRHDLRVELNRTNMAVTDRNSRIIFVRLRDVEASINAAAQAVLDEAEGLTRNRGRTRSLWMEEAAGRARAVLNAHVQAIFDDTLRNDGKVQGVRLILEEARERMLEKVNGEVDDFAAGVWQRNSRPPTGEAAGVASVDQGGSTPSAEVDREAREPGPAGLFNAPFGSGGFNTSPLNTSAFNAGPNTSAFNADEVGEPREMGPPPEATRTSDTLSTSVLVRTEIASEIPLSVSTARGPLSINAEAEHFRLNEGPPSVVEPGPALIEPEWVEGRLTLPKRLPTNDLWDDAVVSLLTAVRAGFVDFIDGLAQAGTNFHPAARRAIEGMPELLSGVPDQVRVFQMGHAVEHLEALQPLADEELPDALRVQYQTVVSQFRRLVERFPDWRALTSKAQAEPLTEEQAQQAVLAAREVSAALSAGAAGGLIDSDIPEALSGLADAAEAASGAERSLLDFDLVASVNQVMTALMRPVVYCWNEFGSGAWDQTKELPREFGSGTVKWGSRIVVGIAALYVGAGSLAPVVAHLAAVYPTLSWLPSVADFLKFIATLPKG